MKINKLINNVTDLKTMLDAYELGANVLYRYRGESHVSVKFVFNGKDLEN